MTRPEADRIIQVMDKRFLEVDKRFDEIDKRFAEVDGRFASIDKRFDVMDRRFNAMRNSVDGRFDDIESKMVTQDQWNRHMGLMDVLVTEIEEIRRQRLFSGEQSVRMESTVDDHEKRIRKLEKTVA